MAKQFNATYVKARSQQNLESLVKGVKVKMKVLLAVAGLMTFAHAIPVHAQTTRKSISDAALVHLLPGFKNGSAYVNDTRIHYVIGGKGAPLVLLPGWPETWWEFHKIMPTLARNYRVIVPDLRGMGTSARPKSGYDKKTMAGDIHGLVRHLGYSKVNMAGHDIGAMVAFAYAANYPQSTRKLAIMDVPHPDDFYMKMSMLPQVGKFGDKIDAAHPGYPWWFAFHQVKGLPEKLLQGRMDMYQDFLLDYLTKDSRSIDRFDRSVYHAAYRSPDAIRSGDAWYQTFSQDVLDAKKYPKLTMPVLGLGSTGYDWLKASLASKGTNVKIVRIANSGHFFPEEQPQVTIKQLSDFFGS
jgi:pimeloyl-ACP methyl ester carboxylesterase